MDPLSITSVTIAALEQTWAIGKKTAELISDFRDFDQEARQLETVVIDEITKTRALQNLLFEPSFHYGGLPEAIDLDDYRSMISAKLSKGASRSIIRLQWSLYNKKRVEATIRKFSELNARVLGHIELLCLGTSVGVDLQHLKRLEEDPNSKKLGFHIDAKLKLTAGNMEKSNGVLEVVNPNLVSSLQSAKKIEDRFAILVWAGKSTLIEYRSYSPDSPVAIEMDSRTRTLIEDLANLLHQPTEPIFRTPSCTGWTHTLFANQIAYMFAIPQGVKPEPRSLLALLSYDESFRPSLSDKFHLAHQLARCISQLHLVKWVHESFRSENVLFFPSADDMFDFSQPWVLGFEYSRPETFFSRGYDDSCISRDVYRHPDRQRSPTKLFNKIHDIYALGVVLLEIGLWQAAITLERQHFQRVHDPVSIKNYLVKQAGKHLGSKTGDKFKSLVIKCLTGDFDCRDDTKEDLKLQQAFRSQVVEVLERLANSV
ncbi:hypothetical protein MMC10_004585 [Thelotrema lepadinum]|nr:hypothetical protein [Thelotrema lepadinum]